MPRKVLYSGLGAVRLAARQPKASAAGVPRLPENRTKGSHCKGHRGINAQAGDSAIRFSGQWFFPSIHPVHVVHIRQLRITSPPIWVFQIAQDLCAGVFYESKGCLRLLQHLFQLCYLRFGPAFCPLLEFESSFQNRLVAQHLHIGRQLQVVLFLLTPLSVRFSFSFVPFPGCRNPRILLSKWYVLLPDYQDFVRLFPSSIRNISGFFILLSGLYPCIFSTYQDSVPLPIPY